MDCRHRHHTGRGTADLHKISTRFQNKCGQFFIVGGAIFHREGDFHRLALAGCQSICLGKCHQPFFFLIQLSGRGGSINLNDLLAGETACVAHGDRDRHIHSCKGGCSCFRGKGGIGQAKAEGISGGNTKGIKVTVAYIDAFFVVCFGGISA